MRLKVIRNHVWSTWGRVPDKEDTDYDRRGDIGEGWHEKEGHENFKGMISEKTTSHYSKDGEGQEQSKEVY